MRVRGAAVAATFGGLVALVVVYVVFFLTSAPAAISAVVTNGSAQLTLQTVASYGHPPFPDWVSYLAKDSSGHWKHTTIFKVPAHTLIKVTIYQYDGASGLRNNFLAKVSGTRGGVEVHQRQGRARRSTRMTRRTPSPCRTSTSTCRCRASMPTRRTSAPSRRARSPRPTTRSPSASVSPGPGTYRWQCFVPCALGFLYGNGGPMQTIGYMDGLIEVS